MTFEIVLPGKWVLAGEHAVLRGASAVALPHPTLGMRLSFESLEIESELVIQPVEFASVLKDLVMRACQQKRGDEGREVFSSLRGKLTVSSTLPMGAGLGSSAALCVAVTRWLGSVLSIAQEDEIGFATRLEDYFHGDSSGMDVAVIAMARPVRFVRGERPTVLPISRLPRFTFHDSGLRAKTSDCVRQVVELFESDAEKAKAADARMGRAALQITDALQVYDHGQVDRALRQLADGMRAAQRSFEDWGLVPEGVQVLIRQLIAQGALAAKITGAGGGGMVVALWRELPGMRSGDQLLGTFDLQS